MSRGDVQTARKILAVLTRCESVLAVTALCVSAAALLADIFARELFQVGLFGSLRVAVYGIAVAAFLGFAICVSHGAHIRITVIDGMTPERIRPFVVRAGHLISFAICAFFAFWALYYVRQTAELGETDPSLRIVVWPIQAAMPWMFISAALRYLTYFLYPVLAPPEEAMGQ